MIAASGGTLIGAGYPGWGRIVVAIGFILIVAAVLDMLWGIASSLWARRRPPRLLGLLDYIPEFTKASGALGESIVRVNEGLNAVAASMTERGTLLQTETDATKRQGIATAIATDIDESRDAMVTEIPTLRENASIMVEALRGFVKVTNDETAELVTFQTNLAGLRANTQSAKRSLEELRQKSRWFRKLNLSAALNRASGGYALAIGDYQRTQAALDRNWRRMEFAMARLIKRRDRAARRRQ